MRKIIDKIADWLVVLTDRKNKTDKDFNTFMNKGNNAFIVLYIFFGILFIYMAFDLYSNYKKLWVALLPIIFFVSLLFWVLIKKSYKNKLKQRYKSSRLKPVGFNLDFNERVLRRVYTSLTKYEYLDENLTSFQDFYNVLVLDFDEHDSALHFTCTQPQLKYILKKFKLLKKGISYVSFERSEKIYHKNKLISSDTLTKKYNEFPPDHEFEQRVDSIFKFLGEI